MGMPYELRKNKNFYGSIICTFFQGMNSTIQLEALTSYSAQKPSQQFMLFHKFTKI